MNAISQRAGWLIAAALGVFVVASMAGVVRGGPLDPSGTPGPTLPQAEPRIPISALPFPISTPGSYFLTKTLHAAPGQAAITITADDVTLDLNGFALLGDSEPVDAISVAAVARVSVANGTIAHWGGIGVNAGAATSGRYERLQIESNTGGGIVTGASSVIASLIVKGNGGNGIAVNAGAGSGIGGVRDSVVEGSVLDDIQVTNNVVVENNKVYNSGVDGIHVLGTGNRIDGNTIVRQGLSAIRVEGFNNLIVRNAVRGTESDIIVGPSNTKGQTETAGTPLTNTWANIVY